MPFRTVIFACLLACLAGCATIMPHATAPPAATPEAMLKEGERLYAKKNYEDAIVQWKKVKESDSAAELNTQAELRIADAQFANKNFIEAAAGYENFRKLHPNHEKAAYALYRLGLCYFHQIEGIDTEQTPVKNTVTMFETFLSQYPASEFAADARVKLETCRFKQLQYEIYIARFYLRTKKYPAAIKRLEAALVQFPKSPINDETLFCLGKAYLKNGDKAKGEQVFTRLNAEFPASKYVTEGKNLLKKF
jgi:outer membrane protein assembly factor BamD